MKIKSILIAGTSSGVGKTSITCGIIHALKQRGYSVQPFKAGPDYIDPLYLSLVSDTSTYNLDAWVMGKDRVRSSFANHSRSDISIIEGVMGYYDGFRWKDYASTHHIATLTNSPTIMVLDASKSSASVAATALGFLRYHRKSNIVGVILNKLGSQKHADICRVALRGVRVPVVGMIPNDPDLSMQSRHLGLLSTLSKPMTQNIQRIAKQISSYIHVPRLLQVIGSSDHNPSVQKQKKPTVTIAVALDSSFNFYYQDNLDALRREGAVLEFFSPVKSKRVPKCDGLYIGGGFPEILGKDLEKNEEIKKTIKRLAEDGLPIYAECGGLMYLTKSIQYDEKKYKMVGLFDAYTQMTKSMVLNYTEGGMANSVISDSHRKFRGHEFHYSKIDLATDSRLIYKLRFGVGINGRDGLVQDMTLASYGHLYFDSGKYADAFVQNCLRYKKL